MPRGENLNDPSRQRKSCHRCGNVRKEVPRCSSPVGCMYLYCNNCRKKVIEELSPSAFENGCPRCKGLCCCFDKSLECTKRNHCYKKCPTTFGKRELPKKRKQTEPPRSLQLPPNGPIDSQQQQQHELLSAHATQIHFHADDLHNVTNVASSTTTSSYYLSTPAAAAAAALSTTATGRNDNATETQYSFGLSTFSTPSTDNSVGAAAPSSSLSSSSSSHHHHHADYPFLAQTHSPPSSSGSDDFHRRHRHHMHTASEPVLPQLQSPRSSQDSSTPAAVAATDAGMMNGGAMHMLLLAGEGIYGRHLLAVSDGFSMEEEEEGQEKENGASRAAGAAGKKEAENHYDLEQQQQHGLFPSPSSSHARGALASASASASVSSSYSPLSSGAGALCTSPAAIGMAEGSYSHSPSYCDNDPDVVNHAFGLGLVDPNLITPATKSKSSSSNSNSNSNSNSSNGGGGGGTMLGIGIGSGNVGGMHHNHNSHLYHQDRDHDHTSLLLSAALAQQYEPYFSSPATATATATTSGAAGGSSAASPVQHHEAGAAGSAGTAMMITSSTSDLSPIAELSWCSDAMAVPSWCSDEPEHEN